MRTAICPECDADVEIPEDAKISQRLECAECGQELVVECLDPLELEPAEDEEDFDDDEDDDEF